MTEREGRRHNEGGGGGEEADRVSERERGRVGGKYSE